MFKTYKRLVVITGLLVILVVMGTAAALFGLIGWLSVICLLLASATAFTTSVVIMSIATWKMTRSDINLWRKGLI